MKLKELKETGGSHSSPVTPQARGSAPASPVILKIPRPPHTCGASADGYQSRSQPAVSRTSLSLLCCALSLSHLPPQSGPLFEAL